MSIIGSAIDQKGIWGSSIGQTTQPALAQNDEIRFQSLKAKIHESLVSSLDLVAAEGLSDA